MLRFPRYSPLVVESPAKMADRASPVRSELNLELNSSNFQDKVFRLLAINVENILHNRTLAKTLTWK